MFKKEKIWLGLCLAWISLASVSCSRKPLEQPYQYSSSVFSLRELQVSTTNRAEGFAANLCVIEEEDDDSAVSAEAAAVFDRSDCQVIFSKNALEKLHPASITKVMTAILAIKYGNLNDLVTVPPEAVIQEKGASLCGIKPGDVLTMEQLLYGLMLPSGNDAAAAIAVHLAGSIEQFSEMMNEEAARLGATSTHFENPHGLTSQEHLTTAYDLYLIFNEALTLPKFREVTGVTAYTANYTDQFGQAVSKTWKGGNWYMTGEKTAPEGLTVFSGKTGTTNAAGYCLIMASRDVEGKEYISVVLKAGNRQRLYENMTQITQKIVN